MGEFLAPPLVKGRALARQRLAGIVFLIVIALLVELAVALYQKKFTPTVDVALKTSSIGNQLSVHADVKLRGIMVGEVRKVSSNGEVATLKLALDPQHVKDIPINVKAELLPKTLFGEKEVNLQLQPGIRPRSLREGDVISQDNSTAALETEKALNDVLPLLKALKPQDLSDTLNALSGALRGRGDQIGKTAVLSAAYFRKLNPSLPTLAQDMAALASVTDIYSAATPNILRTLDNLSFSSRSLVQERADLDRFLQSTSDFSASTTRILNENGQRLIALAADSFPSLDLFRKYSGNYACLLNRVAFSEIEGERTFGGAQPGLHITLELTRDNGSFVAADKPKYLEKRYSGCYGLGKTPIIPFPDYANPQDGYRDSAPPETPNSGPPNCCPEPTFASWQGEYLTPPAEVVSSRSMPQGTSRLDALMLIPLAGLGT
jgi:phospholipid/cholesterol/gamma-HCH transport system substrate-binding protein